MKTLKTGYRELFERTYQMLIDAGVPEGEAKHLALHRVIYRAVKESEAPDWFRDTPFRPEPAVRYFGEVPL